MSAWDQSSDLLPGNLMFVFVKKFNLRKMSASACLAQILPRINFQVSFTRFMEEFVGQKQTTSLILFVRSYVIQKKKKRFKIQVDRYREILSYPHALSVHYQGADGVIMNPVGSENCEGACAHIFFN